MQILQLTQERFILTPEVTISRVSVNGTHECFICEDTWRDLTKVPKVPGKTCIPDGEYLIDITRSERFSKQAGHEVFMPILLNVPHFQGIRIHPGNKPEDTEGCLLPGVEHDGKQVLRSREAYNLLLPKLWAAKNNRIPIKIDIYRVDE